MAVTSAEVGTELLTQSLEQGENGPTADANLLSIPAL